MRQHIERIAQIAAGLDLAIHHPPGDDSGFEQVAAVLGEQLAPARLADLMSGAADALQPPADRTRRLDLDHEIDCAHVDAEFEAARRNDRPQLTAFELILDDDPLLARERAVVGLDQVFDGEAGFGVDTDACLLGGFVELGRQALGLAAGVAEDDRAAMGQHELEDAGVDTRPDAAALRAERCRCGTRAEFGDRLAERAHVLDRHDDLDFQRLADTGIDDRDGPRCTRRAETAEEARDLLEWALRCRQPDSLRRVGRHLLQPFHRQHQMCAALGRGHRVDLVDDDRVDARQRRRRRRREHQVQAFGRSDQQVGWPADECPTIAGAGVAGAHRNDRLHERLTQALGRELDAHQRGSEILLDVEREGAQRRDVEDAGACLVLRRRCGDQPIDRGQECRERLAAACRCTDQGVLTSGDGRPAVDLGMRRLGERGGEPSAHGWREPLEHWMISHPINPTEGVSQPSAGRRPAGVGMPTAAGNSTARRQHVSTTARQRGGGAPVVRKWRARKTPCDTNRCLAGAARKRAAAAIGNRDPVASDSRIAARAVLT